MVYGGQQSHQDSDGHSRSNERVVLQKCGTRGSKENEQFTMQFNESSMRLPCYNPSNFGFKGITN
jgi:hypothetical protein